MKSKLKKTHISVDHFTITSDDRRLINYNSKLLTNYKSGKKIHTSGECKERQFRSYEYFREYYHKRSHNKLRVFVDRYNTPAKKTLYAPNIALKFFSSWENNLTFEEVAKVHNIFVENYHVAFRVSNFHLAVDLYFDANGKDPFEHIVGSIMSGRKVEPWTNPKYPDTYFFHHLNSMFCLVVYNKKLQLLREKVDELSPEAKAELDECYVTRIEFRCRNPHLICSLPVRDLATHNFSSFYPTHLKFLRPDLRKVGNLGLDPSDFKGASLSETKEIMQENRVANNFNYFLRELKSLAEPVKRALGKFRWEPNPDRFPLSKPKLYIKMPRVKFVRFYPNYEV